MAFIRPAAALLVLVLSACSPPVAPPAPAGDGDMLARAPEPPRLVRLTPEASAMQQEILAHARSGSLRRLARLAGQQPGFTSNLGGQDHFQFWDLLRRTGVDPARKLQDLLSTPPGERVVNDETWYVWPDLAARDGRDLVPAKLTFQERRRLQELLGEEGIARLMAGQGYPGMRTAISADGRWIYFVMGQEGEGSR